MLRVLLAGLFLFAAGCAGGGVVLPRTYPVKGTVVFKGGKPMTAGTVQFNSADDPLLRVMGTIGPDGTFTLTTVKDNAKADGAPAGEYRVLVIPPMVSDARDKVPAGHKGVAPIDLPKRYRIEERDNTISIELPPR